MRIAVEWQHCESNGFCAQVAPAVFRLDEDDSLHVLAEQVPAGELDAVELAVRRCPRQALRLEP